MTSPPAATSGRSLLVVANAGADPDKLEEALTTLRRGADVEVVRTRSPDECRDCLRNLDGRRLVVAGGDGTLSSMMGAVRAADLLAEVEIGLLPLGTGNDFARTAGLPLEPDAAAEVILRGHPRAVDLLVDDTGNVVVNAVHAGVGADAAEAGTPLKPFLGPLAYPVGAAAAGIAAQPAPVRIEVDGAEVFDGPALLVGVANGRTIGGGTALAPAAEIDDGLLDVVVAFPANLREKVGFARALRSGDHPERDDVVTFRGETVRISGTPLRYDADGEIWPEREQAAFRVEPRAWTLVTSSDTA